MIRGRRFPAATVCGILEESALTVRVVDTKIRYHAACIIEPNRDDTARTFCTHRRGQS